MDPRLHHVQGKTELVTTTVGLLTEFYTEKLAATVAHQAHAQVVTQYDANLTLRRAQLQTDAESIPGVRLLDPSLVSNAFKGAPSFASCKTKKGKAVSAAVSSIARAARATGSARNECSS